MLTKTLRPTWFKSTLSILIYIKISIEKYMFTIDKLKYFISFWQLKN